MWLLLPLRDTAIIVILLLLLMRLMLLMLLMLLLELHLLLHLPSFVRRGRLHRGRGRGGKARPGGVGGAVGGATAAASNPTAITEGSIGPVRGNDVAMVAHRRKGTKVSRK